MTPRQEAEAQIQKWTEKELGQATQYEWNLLRTKAKTLGSTYTYRNKQ